VKVICGCGHKVALQVPPEKQKFWVDRAHLYMCTKCYQKKYGKSVGRNAAMVREIGSEELV